MAKLHKMSNILAIAALCVAIAPLPSWAADGRLVSPVYSMGLFDPSSPTSSTPILQTSRLAFKGITLDELKAMEIGRAHV